MQFCMTFCFIRSLLSPPSPEKFVAEQPGKTRVRTAENFHGKSGFTDAQLVTTACHHEIASVKAHTRILHTRTRGQTYLGISSYNKRTHRKRMRRYRRDHRTFKRGHKYRTSCRQIICRGSGRSCHNKPVCHIVGKKIAVYLGMHGDCRCRLAPQHRHLIQSIRPEAFGHRFTSDFKQRALLDHPLVAGNDIYQLLCFLKRIARKKPIPRHRETCRLPRCLSRTRCPRANRLPYSCCRKGLFRSPKDNMRNPRLPTPGSLSFQVLRKIRAINRNIRPDTGFHISRYSSSVTHSITLSAQEGAVPPVHCRCRCRCCHKRKRHHNRNAQGYGLSMQGPPV